MASVSTAGLAAGMDIHPPGKAQGRAEGWSFDLIDADFEPTTAKLSAEGRRQGAAAALEDATQRLLDPATWMATQAISSRPDIVQAASDSQTPTGEYRIEVRSLASAQTTSSATFSGLGTTIGLGTLNLEVGSWNGSMSAFMTNPNWPKASLTIGPKDNSLERVRDRINASGVGVLASVISDATGSRLVLRASATGGHNAFKIDATPDEAEVAVKGQADLRALGFDPLTNPVGMGQLQAAQDAEVRLNEQSLQSPYNTIRQAETGLTLQLLAVSDEPVTVRVSPDRDAMVRAVSEFTQRFNEVNANATRSGGTGSPLAQRLNQVLSADHEASGVTGALSQAGLSLRSGGQLILDTDRLGQAIANDASGTRQLFSQVLQAADTTLTPPPRRNSSIAVDFTSPSVLNTHTGRRLLQEYQSVEAEATLSNNA